MLVVVVVEEACSPGDGPVNGSPSSPQVTDAGAYFEYNHQRPSQLVFLSGDQYQALLSACTTPQTATASCWGKAGLSGVPFTDYEYGYVAEMGSGGRVLVVVMILILM